MHSFNPLSSTVDDILQLTSKFLSKLMENGVLKTYTFLYSEDFSCVEKNYGNVVETIDDFKGLLLKICSSLPTPRKDIIEQETFNLLSSNPLGDCIPGNDGSAYASHCSYNLYSANEIDDPLEQNIRFMSNNPATLGNISPNMATECANTLEPRMDFVSPELPTNHDPLKQDNRNIDFSDCENFDSILKREEHIQHSLPPPLSTAQSEMMLSHKAETISYPKNTLKIGTFESNIEALDSIKYSNCNDSLYNTLKEAISGDFLQNMKFAPAGDDQTSKSGPYDEPVPYSQCEPSLQQIDLDILNNSNERINHALDGIFDDQFPENDALLESECWNVDINLPSTEPIPSAIGLHSSNYELPSCTPENLKDKSDHSSLSNNLMDGFDPGNATNLGNSIAHDLNNSLKIENAIASGLNTSIPNGLSLHEKDYEDDLGPKKYYCEHCGFICSSKMKLKIHLKREHNMYINSVNQCDHCGKIFRHRPALLAHIRIHLDIKPYKCQYCWKAFTQKTTHDSHIQRHIGMYKFACMICQKRFPTQAKLNFHMKSHEDPQWRCEICSKMFTTKQYLKGHEKCHNKPIPAPEKCLPCIKCNMLFEKNSDLLLHIRDAHPDFSFTCCYGGCTRSYSTHKKLQDHIYKKHTLNKPANKKINMKFQCNICQMVFAEKDSYHRHNLLVHRETIASESIFSCIHCDKQFTSKPVLDEHLEKLHSSDSMKELDHTCPLCGTQFYHESALNEHMNIHSGFGTFVCQFCQLVFNEKSQYLIHLRGHEEKKPELKKFKCEMCNGCFENRMELRQHELDIHSIVPNLEELKPYACLYCDKRFTTRGKCNIHMETHSNDRKYKCVKCVKQFFRRDLLKEHMNTHAGYRGHTCKVCGLGFSQKSSLKAHTAMHERKDSFTCSQCGKIFQSKQSLNYHIKVHEGNFAYACDVCGKQFVRKCHYDSHRLCHSDERRFKCSKCDMTYKLNKHLRDHMKKSHQNDTDFSSLMNSIHNEDDMISQQSLLHR